MPDKSLTMRYFPLVALACAACAPPSGSDDPDPSEQRRNYATQVSAPSPDYKALLAEPPLATDGWKVREASAPPPPDAKAVGDRWIKRLETRRALLGYGLSGKGPDGPVSLIDTGMTEQAFDSWAKQNGWRVPAHIRWSFMPAMNLPPVSEAAAGAIRVWPASTTRTGVQLQALFHGRVELRDGCFFVGEFDQPADKLARFHAEMGLDKDSEGFLILRNRVSGQTMARLGEEMAWGGPASADIDEAKKQALLKACGDHPIYIVGSPEAKERFLTQAPHLRDPVPPPPPPPEG